MDLRSRLDTRIETIVNLCSGAQLVFDVCCDHGLIGRKLLQRDQSLQSCVFIDQVPNIIDRLSQKVKDARARFACTTGEEYSYPEDSNVVIAGVGAHTAKNIINSIKNPVELVLCIHQNVDQFRQYLFESEYLLLDEVLVAERGRFYEVYKIRNVKGQTFLSLVGSDIFKYDGGDRYLREKIKYYEKKIIGDPSSQNYLDLLKAQL